MSRLRQPVYGMEYRLSEHHQWRKLSITSNAPFGAVELEMHRSQLALIHNYTDIQMRMTVDGKPVHARKSLVDPTVGLRASERLGLIPEHQFGFEASVVDEAPDHVAINRQDSFGISQSVDLLNVESAREFIRQIQESIDLITGANKS